MNDKGGHRAARAAKKGMKEKQTDRLSGTGLRDASASKNGPPNFDISNSTVIGSGECAGEACRLQSAGKNVQKFSSNKNTLSGVSFFGIGRKHVAGRKILNL